MATYKVLQDIESEDKLFGPFTLKQFIFAFIAIGLLVLMIWMASLPLLPLIKYPFIMAILPLFAILAFLAMPLGRDQPNDVWLLARLRFLFKPRTRIWSQEGIKELVTITVPKKEEKILVNNLSQSEVESRLSALASTLDSRGWAVKSVNANMYTQPGYLSGTDTSDRLVSTNELAQDVPAVEVLASDDMFDASSSETASNLDRMLQESTNANKERARNTMTAAMAPQTTNAQSQTPQDYWFMNNQPTQPQTTIPSDYSTFQSTQVVAPGTDTSGDTAAEETEEEKELARKLAAEKQESMTVNTDHMKVITPLHDRDGNIIKQPEPATQLSTPVTSTPAPDSSEDDEAPAYDFSSPDGSVNPTLPPVEQYSSAPVSPASNPTPAVPVTDPDQTQTPNPAIQTLARNNDLNISTLSREAKRVQEGEDGEVIISLH